MRLVSIALAFTAALFAQSTFVNPLLPSGPDPWVTYRGGFYYYTDTTGINLTLWKTRNIADLGTAEKKVVWTPPPGEPYSKEIWAPELHFLDSRWYLYFTAANTNEHHRIWVLEGCPDDPLTCQWTLKGPVADSTDRWAIDATVFRKGRKLYLVWSGYEGLTPGAQNLYIARLKRPWRVEGARSRISTPQFLWEHGLNEAPEVIEHQGKRFMTFSVSGCWADDYALGLLTADAKSDPLKPASWTKNPAPVFSELPDKNVYGPGHNGFFTSPDGKRFWLIYHARSQPNGRCDDTRSPRAQPFSWNRDGSPKFGTPAATGAAVPRP